MKRIMYALLLFCAYQSATATKFYVVNSMPEQHKTIQVSPRWKGGSSEFVPMTSFSISSTKLFDSGYHHLQVIVWKEGGRCWIANVEDLLGGVFGRMRSNVIIKIYANGRYTVNLKGNTEDLRKDTQNDGMARQAQQGNC